MSCFMRFRRFSVLFLILSLTPAFATRCDLALLTDLSYFESIPRQDKDTMALAQLVQKWVTQLLLEGSKPGGSVTDGVSQAEASFFAISEGDQPGGYAPQAPSDGEVPRTGRRDDLKLDRLMKTFQFLSRPASSEPDFLFFKHGNAETMINLFQTSVDSPPETSFPRTSRARFEAPIKKLLEGYRSRYESEKSAMAWAAGVPSWVLANALLIYLTYEHLAKGGPGGNGGSLYCACNFPFLPALCGALGCLISKKFVPSPAKHEAQAARMLRTLAARDWRDWVKMRQTASPFLVRAMQTLSARIINRVNNAWVGLSEGNSHVDFFLRREEGVLTLTTLAWKEQSAAPQNHGIFSAEIRHAFSLLLNED